MKTFITTQDTDRQAIWFRLFGVTRLPVKSDKPRWQVTRDIFKRETSLLAYDLDAARLPEGGAGFAAYMTKSTGHEYRAADVDNYPIKAAGCEAVVYDDETVDSSVWEKRPFLFFGDMPVMAGVMA